MPLYEFYCGDCNQASEILMRSSDWQGAACPRCGSKKLTKQFSTFAAAGSGSAPGAASSGGGGACCGGHCGGHRN